MEQYNDEIHLKYILIKLSDYKKYLLKKKFEILLFSSLCFIIGVLFVISSDVKYNAELTFVVEAEHNSGGSLGSMSGIASQFGFDNIGGSSSATFRASRKRASSPPDAIRSIGPCAMPLLVLASKRT